MRPRNTRKSEITILEEGFTARDFMEEIITGDCQIDKDAFLVADLGDVVKKLLRFLKTLPRVKPFYAIKCNNCRPIVKLLAELDLIVPARQKLHWSRNLELNLTISFMQTPVNVPYQVCSQMMTFDNEVELFKISQNHPNAKMILRLLADDTNATIRLNVKFGAPLTICRHLLETAKKLNVDVIGVSFHVGSGCSDPKTYAQSIGDARLVFEMASELGQKMTLLDIGGGFPGTDDSKITFEEVADTINDALDLSFPEISGVNIIAEPGRYYVASSFSLAANIIAKKVLSPPELCGEENGRKKNMVYYINDGIYGSFSCSFFEKTLVKPIIYKKPSPEQPIYNSSLWGPTCDGLDKIAEHLHIPELNVGDWLLFNNVGAYSMVTASEFNGFQLPKIHFVMPHQTCVFLLSENVQCC
uniref:Orn/DAP/Arg decarboxylase 2 N-terminal domain-containing protein n=1 Tax=Leptobrachium leishanense TaxID=445787 RepID=A0A8C5M301_9ANUR